MEIWFLLPILVTGKFHQVCPQPPFFECPACSTHRNPYFTLCALWKIIFAQRVAGTVDVHLENKDGGFFVKHATKGHFSVVSELAAGAGGAPGGPSAEGSSVLSLDRFTVLPSSEPAAVRASYGPFSTKQSVPTRFIVPDPIPFNASSSSSLQELEISAGHHLDMSAHVVRPDVPRDSPVLRVVFHTGVDPLSRKLRARHQRVCVILHVSHGDYAPLTAACSPDSDEGYCLAQVTIPASWWPPLTPPDADARAHKSPLRSVQVAYSVLEPRGSNSEDCIPRVQIQPVTPLASVPLVQARSAYRELRSDDLLSILLPHSPIYPLSRIHIPIFLQLKHDSTVTGFILRARVKSGMRILSGESSSPNQWTVSVELSPKNTLATLTALRRDVDSLREELTSSLEEVATVLVEVAQEESGVWEEGKIVWSVRYIHAESSGPGHRNPSEDSKKKISSRFEIQKDDNQSVLPISKNWNVVNTAVLTGRQVSQAMKVFTVSQAGKVADVTLQSTCHSDDESVLKVSSSCSSVYVDGTEVRGSSNASVLVKYDTYIGVAKFVVWMPEFPLDLNVADFKLSQIKGWKVPSESNPTSSMKSKRSSDETSAKSKKHSGWTNVASIGGVNVNTVVTEDIGNSIDSEKSNSPCRLRFQQSPVEVYARFLATDHNSGRVSYFVSRQTWLTVTDLVIPSLRVSDPRIATLQGKIVQGRSVGRTKVQVMSPITGRVLGSTDISVTSDKVSLTRMRVHVVSGLQLSITPDTSIDNGFIAQTSVTRKLTAQYQEGLLDIDLEFSDGMRTPLQDISLSDFSLQVESLRPEVVAFAPLVTSSHPRVIAVGPGSGQLLKTILLPAEVCQLQRSTPLATATASVQVDFVPNDRPEFVQNDGGSLSSVKERKLHKEDLNDILIGLPLKDENNHEPTVQARQHHNSFMNPRRHGNVHLSPLEIGMYVLLAAFCFAIVVFVVSCVVYASKFKPHPNDMPDHLPETIPVLGNNHTSGNGLMNMKRDHEEPTTNVHDWVWLGRATLERASGLLIPASANRLKSNINKQIRITSNPTYAAAPNPDVDLQLGTCFDNPNHVELPSQQNIAPPLQIDSKTYCKKNKKHQTSSKILPPLPPLPLEGSVEDCEYRPPVPPHRNTRSSKHRTVDSVTEQPKEKSHKSHHHHHHHHHRHRNINESCHPRHIDQLKNVKKQNSSEKQDTIAAETESSVAAAKFVEYSSPPSEVKRATIVGNPMFSLNDTASDKNKDDLIGLEDLNLGMDYQQIMEYFDNLKESNA